jgi:hypothetical protein
LEFWKLGKKSKDKISVQGFVSTFRPASERPTRFSTVDVTWQVSHVKGKQNVAGSSKQQNQATFG